MLVKLQWLGYRTVKRLWRYVKPFSSGTGTERNDRQTDGRTDRQTDGFAVSISRVSMLTRDKNCAVGMLQLTADKHEASRGLSATAELLVTLESPMRTVFLQFDDNVHFMGIIRTLMWGIITALVSFGSAKCWKWQCGLTVRNFEQLSSRVYGKSVGAKHSERFSPSCPFVE